MKVVARALKLVIAVAFWILRSVLTALARIAGRPRPPTVVVLMYHAVKAAERQRFERQMETVRRLGIPLAGDCSRADLRPGCHHIVVTFDDAYESIAQHGLPALKARSMPATVFAPTHYLGRTADWIRDPDSPDPHESVLSAEELKELRRDGVVIGSHSVSHRRLSELGQADVAAELTESKHTLERILREEITLFALPYGAGTPHIVKLASEAGYTRVFFAEPLWSSWEPEMISIGRIGVAPTDWPLEYRLKVTGAYQWLPLAIAAKRRLRRMNGPFL
jgi:peptidoglycan/xylan/chitin deacetylase (PgdA/CDA1 family)